MGKHRADSYARRWVWPVAVLGLAGLVLAGFVAVVTWWPADRPGAAGQAACGRPVRVVTARSFAPVLAAVTADTQSRDDCLQLAVTTADGRAAAKKAAEVDADVWIPDDTGWAGGAGSLRLAEAPAAGAGAVLATSPLYLVTDRATGSRLQKSGGGWLALARLVAAKEARLVVRDPAGSGDGMVAAAAVAEAVWLDKDMDASALWLAEAKRTTRTVSGDRQAVPAKPGEVGLIPEYALLRDPGVQRDRTVLPGSDHTAVLRYTWLPLAAAAADPVRAAGLERLLSRLGGSGATAYLRSAHLRTPDAAGGTGGEALPPPTAEPFEVLRPHHVDHVFATWYAGDRKTNLLVVVDVSGSMGVRPAGSASSRIELVRQGCRTVAGLLPDDSRMGLWEFGTKLDGARDYRPLLAMTALNGSHRKALAGAVNKLDARRTGTGLYDTLLAAYTSARNAYQAGVPNQVLVLTDGHNEADDNSLSAAQLSAALRAAADPERPVHLSVVTFGKAADAEAIDKAVKPVEGYVDNVTTAIEVAAVFIHVAAGGLHD